MGDGIEVEHRAGVAVITLVAPKVRNAITSEMAEALVGVCEEIDSDDTIGACVIRGAAGTFTTGAFRPILSDIGRSPAGDVEYRTLSQIYDAFVRVGELAVPVVAAVRGRVTGAGLNLMLAADMRIVAEDAHIEAGFIKIGVLPGGGHFVLSSRTMGREGAAALALFGETLTGRAAADRGLAWKALPDGEVEAEAFALAERAGTDPALARAAVRAFREETGPPALPWHAALMYERGPQMWSLHRRQGARQDGSTDGA